ncbi:response regulator transcription factor [Faecalicatena sp. AGMB00832]|uniref:Response regulator transcription factor n=1 Tax=Faecalicatena faecalis TaxID=2726362 RepID=A0ABS6D6I3_9FIRM|nr:response regulator transcription factor [Faecalicatena faecalis]MBU3877217.1 response regulator transcription factor [Faecalicatena faecalis]
MKILLLEDDTDLCGLIQAELKKNGYVVDSCNDGETAMLYTLNTDYCYDLAVVDRMLPIIDGLTIIKAMRQKGIQIPVIITTGMSGLDDRIEGLDGGADDYLVKPFHVEELLARIRALTRRPAQIKASDTLTYADLSFDKSNRIVSKDDRSLVLTAKESELLYVLMEKPKQLFTREQLVLKIWGSSSDVEPGNVDNYISFLRKRLRELLSCCEIKTVYGAGYRLEKKDHA